MSDPHPSQHGSPRTEQGSARIKFRRALTLMAMTLFLPGSAQIVTGNKRVGRIALRVWIISWATVGLVVLLALTWRSSILTLVTSGSVMWCVRTAAVLIAVGWAALFFDAWRLGAPLELRRPHRLAMAGVNSLLCFVTAGSLLFGAHVMSVQQDFMGAVFGGDEISVPKQGRYNVLLLGADSGKGRVGLRPDSLSVASIDQETGKTVLVGLPRNLANVRFPEGSTMYKEFPNGFDCEGCYLNSVNTWAEDRKDLFPGVKHPGIVATKQAVEATTGLKINYYAMVNLRGFRALVDSVGGVRIQVPARVPIGGIGSPITGYVPKGTHTLNGNQTLWFARSRVANNDYSRMARQKCVMSAMLQQLSPRKILLNVEDLADSSKKMLETDIPEKDSGTFIDLALKARSTKVSTVSIVPPAINTSDPDIGDIRAMVKRAVDKSEGKPVQAAKGPKLTRAQQDRAERERLQAPDRDKKHATAVNDSEDLTAAC